MALICAPPHPSRLFAVPPSPRGEGFCHGECGYYMVVDCTTNTGYDGTNEAYTGGASYDGRRGQSGNLTQSDGEGREGIPELLRNVENGSGPRTGSDDLEERGTTGGSQVLRGFLNVSPETQAAVERSGATPIELKS